MFELDGRQRLKSIEVDDICADRELSDVARQLVGGTTAGIPEVCCCYAISRTSAAFLVRASADALKLHAGLVASV